MGSGVAFGAGPSFSWGDVYPGIMGAATSPGESTQASGPSGNMQGGTGPAYSWLTLILVLVLIRVLYEYAEKQG